MDRDRFLAYWGLTRAPFHRPLDPARYFESAEHAEALSRLLYVAEHKYRACWLKGAAGTGKTLLLKVLEQHVKQWGYQTAFVDLAGQAGTASILQLCERFGLFVSVEPNSLGEMTAGTAAWTRLSDFLHASRFSRQPLAILLDHADFGGGDIGLTVRRLIGLARETSAPVAILCASREQRLGQLGNILGELCDLQAVLAPLSLDEVSQFVDCQLAYAGSRATVFTPEAIELVTRETIGIPAAIIRLCDLGMVAAMGDECRQVTPNTIRGVCADLLPRRKARQHSETAAPDGSPEAREHADHELFV